MLLVGECLFGGGYFGLFVVDHTGVFVDVLFAEFDLKGLEFDFFRQEVKFAVVAHIVDLHLVCVDLVFRFVDLLLFDVGLFAQFLNILAIIGYAGVETLYVVFKVTHFEGKFSAYGLYAVYLREYGL